MKILGNEIKPGMILDHDNDQWEVIKTQHVKPGKGGAFNQVELKSLIKDTKRNERFRSSDNVERVVLEDKNFNFLFEDKALSVELPFYIECIVISTDAALKGQTVSSSYKPAIINKDLKILVPPFIENGDEIAVDSRSLEYIKKIK